MRGVGRAAALLAGVYQQFRRANPMGLRTVSRNQFGSSARTGRKSVPRLDHRRGDLQVGHADSQS